ncbi:MAG TPA: ZmpA/ZmpB/ZmpC family metallo-endopeptidase-related protein [Rhizomicrobium sp.]|nr:ZmpA/ZmpB/ZmpC family metallo-endopeptidase-related protein [Rhizomicrobium sp.]
MFSKRAALAILAAIGASATAHADVTISPAATENMTCMAGVCFPTATDAVLNVSDLETLLASGNVTVTTTGSGVQANNITIAAPLTWPSPNTLALDAYKSVTIDKHVSVGGSGGLTITTNDGGTGGMLSFGPRGWVKFANLTSQLVIDGAGYMLVSSIQLLANAVAANPGGNFALARDYDARPDGVYTNPVVTPFSGNFQGLGNSIAHLKIKNRSAEFGAGLFSEISGAVENLTLRRVQINGEKRFENVGGIVAYSNNGLLYGVHVDGTIAGIADSLTGGIVGQNNGTIRNSSSAATILGGEGADCGGVAGYNIGTVDQSFASGAVGWHKGCQFAGGLLGFHDGGTVSNSYATGGVFAGLYENDAGGLIGEDMQYSSGEVSTSYSTGSVQPANYQGGFIGYLETGDLDDCNWDKTTSGTRSGTGNFGNVPNITGMTSKKLRSALPAGFDPAIWSQDKKINNGFPYLIANPPAD